MMFKNDWTINSQFTRGDSSRALNGSRPIPDTTRFPRILQKMAVDGMGQIMKLHQRLLAPQVPDESVLHNTPAEKIF